MKSASCRKKAQVDLWNVKLRSSFLETLPTEIDGTT
jgi:hypothetical protein